MTAPTHSAPPGTTTPTAPPPVCGTEAVAVLECEAIWQALPLDAQDRQALEHNATEAAFAALAADHTEQVAPETPPEGYMALGRIKAYNLNFRLQEAVGAPFVEVRITPQQWASRAVFCTMAISPERREIPLPKGAAAVISDAIRAAFPTAQWDHAQNYHRQEGCLREHKPRLPSFLRERAS